MTSTDKAFLAAFRRETKPPKLSANNAQPQSDDLPGAGVEVVTFSTAEPAQRLKDRPVLRNSEPTDIAHSTGQKPFQPKRFLHPPHANVATTSGRKPLSSYVRERDQPEESDEFRPATIVERMRWPAICAQLGAEHSDQLASVLETVGRFPSVGAKILGIAGSVEGVGCTTLALALARQAARLGRRVIVVEADTLSPCFQSRLGLTSQHGLSDALADAAVLQEATTYAHDDRAAVIPWGDASPMAIQGRQRLQLSLAAGRLRFAFDLVLVDLGAPTSARREALELFAALHGDATLLVTSKMQLAESLDEFRTRLESIGRPVLGIIENDVPTR